MARNIGLSLGAVKREVRPLRGLLHVKHSDCRVLLADTEIRKDHIQQIFDIDTARNPPECAGRQPQVFSSQFRHVGLDCAEKGVFTLCQSSPMP